MLLCALIGTITVILMDITFSISVLHTLLIFVISMLCTTLFGCLFIHILLGKSFNIDKFLTSNDARTFYGAIISCVLESLCTVILILIGLCTTWPVTPLVSMGFIFTVCLFGKICMCVLYLRAMEDYR